jgi:hypothetical protein
MVSGAVEDLRLWQEAVQSRFPKWFVHGGWRGGTTTMPISYVIGFLGNRMRWWICRHANNTIYGTQFTQLQAPEGKLNVMLVCSWLMMIRVTKSPWLWYDLGYATCVLSSSSTPPDPDIGGRVLGPGWLHVRLSMYGLILVLHARFLGFDWLLHHGLHQPSGGPHQVW